MSKMIDGALHAEAPERFPDNRGRDHAQTQKVETQEACAERMHVARTTAQAMYRNARHKIADCLVNSRRLIIEGGDYLVCNAREMTCGCPHCRRLIQPADGETPKITP